jgi:nicotinamidase-related amidase
MALTTIDATPALVVIDLQKGIVALRTAHPVDVVVRNSGGARCGVPAARLPGRARQRRRRSGVESTARAAHEHGYHVVLATDAMTDRSAEVHANSVERIFPGLGETATTAEIRAGLEDA